MEVVKYKLKKDDLVQVTTGKEKGKSGKILKIDREKGKVLVAGLNMVRAVSWISRLQSLFPM